MVKMNHSDNSSYRWVFNLAVGFLVGGVYLRTLLTYPLASPFSNRSLILTTVWLVLFLGEPLISRRARRYFLLYLLIQAPLIFLMLQTPEEADYFAILYSILAMQIMDRFEARVGVILIALFTPLTILALLKSYSFAAAAATGFLYATANALLGAYALGTRRALAVRHKNQALVQELEEANRQMVAYSRQVEQLAAADARNHLARELHDSVTQTIFSMTLTTQSAMLLLERNPSQVTGQLDRLTDLAQNALAEMRLLVSKLTPSDELINEGLEAALRKHIEHRSLPEGLNILFEIEGDKALDMMEQQTIFRIIQEAINNVVKHAHASSVILRLHLQEPLWIEVEDNGTGFNLPQSTGSSGMGLASMRERAAQIGWGFHISSSPGSGTCIRIEKPNEKRVE
jgi:signal transduction histidine kinase